jgi:hypothetical protein
MVFVVCVPPGVKLVDGALARWLSLADFEDKSPRDPQHKEAALFDQALRDGDLDLASRYQKLRSLTREDRTLRPISPTARTVIAHLKLELPDMFP